MVDGFSTTEEIINEFILFHLTYTFACSLIHALKGFLPVPLPSSPSLIISSVVDVASML